MRNLILTLCSFFVFSSAVQAKMILDETQSFQVARAVKIGRSAIKLATDLDEIRGNSSDGGENGITFVNPCHKRAGNERCTSCDYAKVICEACVDGYYAHYTASQPNCMDVCSEVVCRSGFHKVRSGNTCTCQ